MCVCVRTCVRACVRVCVCVCDRIWENVYSSDIRFCSFEDTQKPLGMVYRHETLRDDKGIIVLQSLKVSHLSLIPNGFHESPKLKNWMCELCTFSHHVSMFIPVFLTPNSNKSIW